MKTNYFSFFAIAITISITGCGSVPKVTDYGRPIDTYTLGQESKNAKYADEGKIWNSYAKKEQADRLAHQRRMKQMEYISKERDFADSLDLDYMAPPAGDSVPTAAPPQAVAPPTRFPSSRNNIEYRGPRGPKLLPNRRYNGTSTGSPMNPFRQIANGLSQFAFAGVHQARGTAVEQTTYRSSGASGNGAVVRVSAYVGDRVDVPRSRFERLARGHAAQMNGGQYVRFIDGRGVKVTEYSAGAAVAGRAQYRTRGTRR